MPPLGFLQWKRGRIAQSFYPVPEKSMSFSCRHFKASARKWIIDDHCISYPLRIFTICIYICVYIYIYRTCLLRSSDTWPFSLHILLPSDGHTELPPTQPQRPTPSDFKRWEYCHKYKLLARLCPCHESKICRIMPTSGPPSTSATAASLSRRLVWRRRAESDSHSDGAQKYMCSNRSNSTWWLIPLSKWVIFWLSPGWVGLIHLQLGYNPLAKWDEPPSNILWSRAALLDWVVANSKYGNVKSSHQAGRGART